MRSIWKSLIKDPKAAINDHFDIILRDLLTGLGDRQWRSREASSNALADLLHGREIAQVEGDLEEIWTMVFRCLDDIKESVRVSALATCKSLLTLTIRYCDPHHTAISQGQKIMDIVLPFFLNNGLFSISEVSISLIVLGCS
jgi:proteasome component ECM29